LVVLGHPEAGCAPNTVSGPVTISGTQGLSVLAGNSIRGPLSCTGNDPAPVNRGRPNEIRGPASGQCSAM
jgi:hypothetical protein